MQKKKVKARDAAAARLAANRRAFGKAGAINDKRKEQSKRAARGKCKIEG